MGWASGSRIMSNIITDLQDRIADDVVREEVYSVLIEAFKENDCDTLNECYGEDPAFDAAYDDSEEDWDEEDLEDLDEEDWNDDEYDEDEDE